MVHMKLPKLPHFPRIFPQRQLGLQDLKRGIVFGVATLVFIYFAVGVYFVTSLFFESVESNTMAASLAVTHHMDICAKISSYPYPVFRCMNMTTACTYAPSKEMFECENFKR